MITKNTHESPHPGTDPRRLLPDMRIDASFFRINFCEYNRSNAPQTRIYRPRGSGDYLFLLLKTPMKFYLNERLVLSRENACILYTPDTPQDYQAVNRFSNSYLHFSCAKDLGAHFGIPENTLFYPHNYEEIDAFIRRLQEEYIANAPFSQEQSYHLVCSLMIASARGLSSARTYSNGDSELFQRFSAMRFEMLRHCEKTWSTEQLCRQVNLEKSRFFAYYQQCFHSTPHADLLQVRMELAKNLLSNQALPIKQVAAQCGFQSLAHFSRSFKKYTGCSPRDFATHDRV